MSRLRSYLASNTLLRNLATMYPSSCHHCIKRLMATWCYCRNCALADKLRRLPSNQWPIQYQSFNINQWEIGGTSKLMPRWNSNLNQRVNDTSCQCANAWRKLILQLPNGLWQKKKKINPRKTAHKGNLNLLPADLCMWQLLSLSLYYYHYLWNSYIAVLTIRSLPIWPVIHTLNCRAWLCT